MKNYNNIVLLTDLDGTLLNTSSMVSSRNKEAIEAFISGGGKFGIATGRGEKNALKFIGDLKINIPSILFNGCGLYDYKADEYLELKSLSSDRLKEFLNDCLKRFTDVVIQIYTTKGCMIITPEELIDDDIRKNHSPFILTKLDDIMDEKWIKVLFRGNKEELNDIEELGYKRRLNEEMTLVYSSNIYLEILPSNSSKGSMLESLRKLLGEEYTYYAVGDYYNDIEMIKAADVGMATGNAPEDIKAIADIVTVSNDDDVLADIIYNIMKR